METQTTAHLRRMAEELKCPICLSLLKCSVSLTCNHIFCNVCIDKSMKSDSTCPVCKVPYTRREVRPAPHMDSLVSIYKNMEVSSGVNILVTQTEPQTQGNEKQTNDEIICGSKTTSKACRSTPNTQKKRKKKTRNVKGSSKGLKRYDSDIERPSFPTKKRIQVPQHPPQETPTRPSNLESGKVVVVNDKTQSNVSGAEDMAHLHENGDTLFTPFFWLRNEVDSEDATQPTLTPFAPVNESPPDAPCFSDIKDSLDDHPSHTASKDGNMFDSEMFEWTQRPCSPELCASPLKTQAKQSDGCNRIQENGGSHVKGKKAIDTIEVVLPTLSPLKKNEVVHEAKVKGVKKRAKKTRESIQKKRVKRDRDIVVGICAPKADQDDDKNTSEPVKCKKQNRSGKKVVTAAVEEASNHGDGSTAGLSNSLNLKKCSDNIDVARSTGKKKKEITNQQHTKRTKRLKNHDSRNGNNNVAELNKDFISQLPTEPSLNVEIDACASSKHTKNGHVSKSVKTSKKVTFSTNEPMPSKYADTKVSQPMGEVNCSSMEESNPTRKSNATFLNKCSTLSYMRCAFCQSTEESNITGCMTHYLKGKPITLDQEGVSNAIHAHRNCTEWAPNVYFEDDIAVNLEAELTRSKRIKCSCCGLKCAALGCYEKTCRKSFHFTCAKLTPQCRWDDDNFVMLCPLHASQKLPNEACGSQLKDKKKYVQKRQAIIKQSQVNVDTVSTASRWESSGLFTKMLLCCSALTSTEKETVEKFEKLSGVTVLKKWDSRVTHVIASVDENGACRRTLKYLMGIIEGKWILNIEWIKACLEVKKPVDEQLYEINIDIHGFKGGPKLGRSRLLNKEPKLFNGFKFYFTGDFVASYKGYLHDLIIAAGGTVLHRKPVPMNNEQQFLVYSIELPDKLKPNEQNQILSQRKSNAEALANSCGAVAVSNSWILNSIAAAKVQDLY